VIKSFSSCFQFTASHRKGRGHRHYLWPFFHVRHGDGLHGWQFWPLVGDEHKIVTTTTNGFGDTTIVGGHDKFFALWPIYFHYNTGIGTDDPERFRAVIPLYDYTRSPKRDSTTVLWPFFSWIDDREKKYHEWQGPCRSSFSRAAKARPPTASGRCSASRTTPSRKVILTSGRFIPSSAPTPTARPAAHAHPVFIFRKTRWKKHGDRRGQAAGGHAAVLHLSPRFQRQQPPANPGAAGTGSAEQPWHRAQLVAAVVALVRKTIQVRREQQSFLWNLYRHESTPTSKKCSLLFGLFHINLTRKLKVAPVLHPGVPCASQNRQNWRVL